VRREKGDHLEHLNECYAEVEIGLVTADQTRTKQDSDGDDGSKVDSACHPDCLSAIEECSRPSQNLGHHR
jgi:hypothetical protein